MAQAAVVLRRNHEKEKRRREQEQLIDQYVNSTHNSDTSCSGAGRANSPENLHSIALQNRKVDSNSDGHHQRSEKDVWVGFYSIFSFVKASSYSTEHANAPHNLCHQ